MELFSDKLRYGKIVASLENGSYFYGKSKIKVMPQINRSEIEQMISNLANGTIYSVTFTKKDGSVRLMNSIKGTSKGVKGVGAKYDFQAKRLLPVYDLQLAKQNPEAPEKAWRTISLDTISQLKVNKEVYEVV